MYATTGIEGQGKPVNRQALQRLIGGYKEDRVYGGEAGDILPFIMAHQLQRPILLVDLHKIRSTQLTMIDPELIFVDSAAIHLPIVLVRE